MDVDWYLSREKTLEGEGLDPAVVRQVAPTLTLVKRRPRRARPLTRPARSTSVTCPNATDSSQVMPISMNGCASARPGMSSSFPFGAPLPTNTASYTGRA